MVLMFSILIDSTLIQICDCGP